MKKPYFLIDTETTNLVGSYASERAALRAVAATAERYGPNSEAATSLALIREDAPAGKGLIARGRSLVKRALDGATPVDRRAPASRADSLAGRLAKLDGGVARTPGAPAASHASAATGRAGTAAKRTLGGNAARPTAAKARVVKAEKASPKPSSTGTTSGEKAEIRR
jgi:hypothetical protein